MTIIVQGFLGVFDITQGYGQVPLVPLVSYVDPFAIHSDSLLADRGWNIDPMKVRQDAAASSLLFGGVDPMASQSDGSSADSTFGAAIDPEGVNSAT